jgi:hypothetical protein
MSEGGKVRPIAFAAAMLRTSSIRFPCTTGRSRGVGALEDAVDVGGALAVIFGEVDAIRHQPADQEGHPLLI